MQLSSDAEGSGSGSGERSDAERGARADSNPLPLAVQRTPSIFGILATFTLLTLIWGTTWAAIRIGLESIPPFTGVSIRFALASVVLLLIARKMRVPLGRTSRERRLWLVVTAFSFAGSYGVVYWAEQWVPSGLAAVLFATLPLFVGLEVAFLLPNERLGPLAVLGTLLGFGGIVVIFSEDFTRLGGPHLLTAALVMLISPLSSSFGTVAVKRWGQGIHPLSLTSVPMGLTALILGALAVVFERDLPMRFDARAVGSVVYLGLFGTALTFTLYYWLLSYLSATVMALISYTVPVVAVLIGTFFLKEPFSPHTAIGSFLVLLGVALAARPRPKPRDQAAKNVLPADSSRT